MKSVIRALLIAGCLTTIIDPNDPLTTWSQKTNKILADFILI